MTKLLAVIIAIFVSVTTVQHLPREPEKHNFNVGCTQNCPGRQIEHR